MRNMKSHKLRPTPPPRLPARRDTTADWFIVGYFLLLFVLMAWPK